MKWIIIDCDPGVDDAQAIMTGVWALRDRGKASTKTKHYHLNNSISFLDHLPPESFEDISNRLRTIKQYREFQSPDETSWKEYIKEIFHI